MKAAVVGYPVKHSRSPEIFKDLVPNLDYEVIEVKPSQFNKLIKDLALSGEYVGVNITHPFKAQAFKLAEIKDESCKKLGVCNVLSFSQGKVIASNSDVFGFSQVLKKTNFQVQGAHCVIFGAGGAARAALQVLLSQQPASMTVVNRTLEHAVKLMNEFTESDAEFVVTTRLDENLIYDIYINSTPLGTLGHQNGEGFWPLQFSKNAQLIDMVYNPPQTYLMQKAQEQGLKIQNGLIMLKAQAQKTAEIWGLI